MLVVLEVIAGGQVGREVKVRKDQTCKIGRTNWADEVFGDDVMMSGQHFEIQNDGSYCWLRDLNSRNGTRVDTDFVKDNLMLRDGQRVTAGRTQFLVRIEGGAKNPYESTSLGEFEPVKNEALLSMELPDQPGDASWQPPSTTPPVGPAPPMPPQPIAGGPAGPFPPIDTPPVGPPGGSWKGPDNTETPPVYPPGPTPAGKQPAWPPPGQNASQPPGPPIGPVPGGPPPRRGAGEPVFVNVRISTPPGPPPMGPPGHSPTSGGPLPPGGFMPSPNIEPPLGPPAAPPSGSPAPLGPGSPGGLPPDANPPFVPGSLDPPGTPPPLSPPGAGNPPPWPAGANPNLDFGPEPPRFGAEPSAEERAAPPGMTPPDATGFGVGSGSRGFNPSLVGFSDDDPFVGPGAGPAAPSQWQPPEPAPLPVFAEPETSAPQRSASVHGLCFREETSAAFYPVYRSTFVGVPQVEFSPSALIQELSKIAKPVLAIHFMRAEKPIPEDLEGVPLRADLDPKFAPLGGPMLYAPQDLQPFCELIDELWGLDAVSCFFTQQDPQAVIDHFRQGLFAPKRGDLPSPGPGPQFFAVFSPNLLTTFLATRDQHTVDQLLGTAIDGVLTEMADLPDSWQLYTRQPWVQNLKGLGMNRVVEQPQH